MSKAIERSRTFRREPTHAEKKLWEKIRKEQLGIKFRRQVPIGPFFADFACLEFKLIVEVDGGQHSESVSDERRTKYLADLGFEVVRFWNNDVTDNIEGTVDHLIRVIAAIKAKRG